MIQILLVDDQNIIRQGLQALFESTPELKIVGTARDGNGAIEQVEVLRPDIVLMDLEMPGMSGIIATKRICRQFPETKVLVLSSHDNQKYVIEALQAGAQGYLLKSTFSKELEQAVISVYRGHSQIESILLAKVVAGLSSSNSVTVSQKNDSISVDRQLSKLETEINAKSCLQKKPGSIPSIKNKPLPRINKTISLKSVFKPTELEAEKPRQKDGISLANSRNWFNNKLTIVSILLIATIILISFWNHARSQLSFTLTQQKKENMLSDSQIQLPEQESETKTQINKSQQVVALGRLTPKGEVIKLSVANAEDSRVNQVLVEEGDHVKKNQVIAILQGIDRRKRDLEEAKKNVELAKTQLEKTRVGDTKQAELAAQRANIYRLESQLRNEIFERQAAITSANAQLRQANLTYNRNKSLQKDGAVSQQTLDRTQESLDIARASLNERQAQLRNTKQTLKAEISQEQENLAQLQEIRPIDVKVAELELERAIIAVEQSKADVEDAKVKVPISGQILRINTRVGEQVNIQKGIVELGFTNKMYAIAEVYETDIGKVKIGQPATISSEYGGFEGSIKGTVEHLGLQIGGKQLSESSEDPTQDENSRIVEVKIRINPGDSSKVAGLTNMKVRVEINN